MPEWKNVKVRGDLHRMVAQRAQEDRRSISQMADVLLTRALTDEIPATIRPRDRGEFIQSPEIEEAAVARTFRAPVAQRTEGRTTVDEMLASCPQCAGKLQKVDVTRGGSTIREGAEACVDCGWVREPAGADGHGR
jgi:hypothetical protein